MSSDVARRAGNGIQALLLRLATLLRGLLALALVVATATFITGWWVFHHGWGWIVLGGLVCLVPVVAATLGWGLVRRAATFVPRLIDDISTYIRDHSAGSQILIDYDSGQPIGVSAKRFGTLRDELSMHKSELRGLWLGVRAAVFAPPLAAIAVLGTMAVGALGAILLISGLTR
jgi:hypothetical protein